ncbi:mitochondrial 37S ribosomal protein mS47 KNAG_0H01230 [Huiozyma naganishii CBS 8797]|uniref:3-hydroxyisobutyryl-CoA hydrolase n=1 Tax=Huiozyma naganishii (strain ATCC MYA-139 / BCRC 22969 / CBS 8797 / KCTC 17520 / NBRC 10181 / NCYC 3082 / Yp74L-3) TaxID=1071383 RepID=J7S9J9_HUIN7|nr:hypothetical protein KNAG_0H01230 [Kazachstania naganishii CBS 8797]CCK71536.1 hypothetical protein KNAG_0H01230 [Kazachstania naganishii CBS 8797]
MLRVGTKQRFAKTTLSFFGKRTKMGSSAAGVAAQEPPVLFNVNDKARVVTLNRPAKLNALNTQMCTLMFQTLNEYSKSDSANLIIIKSSNFPRSLCAGGDVASVAMDNLAGEAKRSVEFFTSEYSLNYQLATFNKPTISIMDGITMGGGVGVSIHSPFRIATENTKWAMPEMDIGFFPDVGTTFALPRVLTLANLHGQMSLYLCLTGDVLSGEDAYMLGLASHYVSHENLKELEVRLSEIDAPDVVELNDANTGPSALYDMIDRSIKEFGQPRFPPNYKFRFSDAQLSVIEKCFDIKKLTSVEDLIASLEAFYNGSAESKTFANEVKDRLMTKSLSSMGVALRLLQENSKDHVESAIRRDLFTAANMCYNFEGLCEFSEATKHKLVDKSRTPYPWKLDKPLTSSQVTSLTSIKPSITANLWPNNVNVTWKDYPFHLNYQLPTEKLIEQHIKKSEGNGKLDLANFQNSLLNVNPNTKDKLGMKMILDNIIRRKCTEVDKAIRWVE